MSAGVSSHARVARNTPVRRSTLETERCGKQGAAWRDREFPRDFVAKSGHAWRWPGSIANQIRVGSALEEFVARTAYHARPGSVTGMARSVRPPGARVRCGRIARRAAGVPGELVAPYFGAGGRFHGRPDAARLEGKRQGTWLISGTRHGHAIRHECARSLRRSASRWGTGPARGGWRLPPQRGGSIGPTEG